MGKSHDLGLGNDFFGYDCKDTATKTKNKLTRLHQTKNHLRSKRNNQQKGATTRRMRENIADNASHKGLTSICSREKTNLQIFKKFSDPFRDVFQGPPHTCANGCQKVKASECR